MKICHLLFTTAAVIAAGLPAVANAGTATGTLEVKVIIQAGCTVNFAGNANAQNAVLDFGTRSHLAGDKAGGADAQTDATSSGAIRVRCTKGQKYSIGLGNGKNYDTTSNSRRMSNNAAAGPEFINYALYKDSARTLPWGDTNDSDKYVSSTDDASVEDHTYAIYGRIPQKDLPTAGLYTDTVAINVTY